MSYSAEQIAQVLFLLEKAHGVKVLYAAEAGSRAWGFASPDSDYDVRFIYVLPVTSYLSLDKDEADTISETVADMDIHGWDLFKTLRLARKSNPSLIEWLFSPIVYYEESPRISQLREFVRHHFSPKALARHYVSLAESSLAKAGEGVVGIKNYLYAVRSLLCAAHVVDHGMVPPVDIQALREASDDRGLSGLANTLTILKINQPKAGRVLEQFEWKPLVQARLRKFRDILGQVPERSLPEHVLERMLKDELRESCDFAEYCS